MNKTILIVGGVAVVVLIAVFFVFNGGKPAAPGTQNNAPVVPGPTVANCGSDQNCLLTNFIACSPAKFSTPFAQGEYVIEIVGAESDKCHYNLSNLATGIDCRIPKTLMTEERVRHLFGMDKEPGKEQVLAAQNSLDALYCNETLRGG